MKKAAFGIFAVLFTIFLAALRILVSPYKYEWEPTLKTVNGNAVDVLKVVYLVCTVVLLIMFFALRKKFNAFMKVYTLLAIVYCIFSFATLLQY